MWVESEEVASFIVDSLQEEDNASTRVRRIALGNRVRVVGEGIGNL